MQPRPLVMGILNVTPDSFFDGGSYPTLDRAVERGIEMVSEGADIVDVGGESTRPGAIAVTTSEELVRVVEVIQALAHHVRVSIDTTKPKVAEKALEAGATIVNDVSASLEHVAAAAGAGWIAMHRRGDPQTMSELTGYCDVVAEVREFLRAAAQRGFEAGVNEVWVDPGIGFAKTAQQSYALLSAIPEIAGDGVPVLVGASRKSLLGGLPSTRREASLAVAAWSMLAGASVVRVHDVAPTVAAVRLIAVDG